MTTPESAATSATLRNGLAITLRPLRPDDRERIAAAVRALDRESIYLRLFSYRKELTEAGLDRIMAVDPAHDFVVLATVVAGAEEVVIGSARYVAAAGEAGRRTAEVAFMVEEDYRGLGIAGRLLARLAEIARGRGIAEFTAEVLPENKAMLGVFARCGWPMSRRSKDGVVHLTLELRPGALPGG